MLLEADDCILLLIDFQARLMPAIAHGAQVLDRAEKLAKAALLLDVPIVATEENPSRIGSTVSQLAAYPAVTLAKMHFDATAEPDFWPSLPAKRSTIVVAGCEAHVCVLQTVLGLLGRAGLKVALVTDAVGSRAGDDRQAAIRRMRRHGAEMVTTEMVIFEWLRTAEHPRFREGLALVK